MPRPRRTRHASSQLSFDDALFSARAAGPVQRSDSIRRPHREEPVALDLNTSPGSAGSLQEASSNVRELRASLRNCLTALSTATTLMVRHAPEPAIVGELGEVVLRQVRLLSHQLQTLESMTSECDAAEV